MKSLCISGIVWTLAVLCGPAGVRAQMLPGGSPSLLPLPEFERSGTDTWYSSYAPADSAAVDLLPTADSSEGREPISPSDDGYQSVLSTPLSDKGCTCQSACGGSPWHAGIRGLLMSRDDGNNLCLSFDTNVPEVQAMRSGHASMDWEYGYEATVGRCFCSGYALEATYWGVFAMRQESRLTAGDVTGFLNSTFNDGTFDQLDLGAVSDLFNIYDAAGVHRVRRDYEFHNLELNLIGGPLGFYCGHGFCDRVRFQWLAGLRYFKFDEDFQYAATQAAAFGADPVNEAFYDIEVENELIGSQLGFRADFHCTNRLRLYAGPKFGVYLNNIHHRSRIYNTLATAVVNNGPNLNRSFDVTSAGSEVALLGEANIGVDYDITRRLTATLGYRVVAVTGVALTTNQIPGNFADIDGVAELDDNGSLILHGLYAGIQYGW